MITLPNGDKWIIDKKELENISYEEASKGNVPETSIDDFIRQLVNPPKDVLLLPRKLTPKYGGYWDANYNPAEVLQAVARKIHITPFFQAYEMSSGEIHVIYCSPCPGEYDFETKTVTYPNKQEYLKAVVF